MIMLTKIIELVNKRILLNETFYQGTVRDQGTP